MIYSARLGKRAVTMDRARSLLPERAHIVETGCLRSVDNWDGDGMSTLVWAAWAEEHDGRVWTVDTDAAALGLARQATLGYRGRITYTQADSVAFLTNFAERIDLLYLDSMDYPFGTLLDLTGGKDDLDAALAALHATTEAEIVERYGDIIGPSQEHCLAELIAAWPQSGALVLIDDAQLPGGGKARLAKQWMAAAGWTLLLDEYQTLWQRP